MVEEPKRAKRTVTAPTTAGQMSGGRVLSVEVSPRPALPQARATSVLLATLGAAFDLDDEPGGWIMLFAPELHFGNDVLVPDIAGWRRERLPSLPNVAYLTLAPEMRVVEPGGRGVD